MLNPRILQLGDKSGNIAMYNVLEKYEKVRRFFFIVF